MALVLVAVVAAVARPVTLRGVALVTVVEALGFDGVPRPFAPDVDRTPTVVGGVEVDRYAPVPSDSARAGRRPAIVLLPGATPTGRDDQRVVAIARSLARADRVVLVPELAVYQETLVATDIDRIVDVAAASAVDHEVVVLAGLSFGGSLGLIAADDPTVRESIGLVATFGAYADLAGVIQAVTTGVSLVDGERIAWSPDPRAEQIVRDQLLGLVPDEDRTRIEAAVAAGLGSPVGGVATSLPDDLQAVVELVTADDPSQVLAAVDRAPAAVRERITAVSPARAAPDLDVDIVAMHTVDDPVIPYGELARLTRTYPDAEPLTLTTFDHVGLGDGGQSWWVTARDLWRTARFVHAILAAR